MGSDFNKFTIEDPPEHPVELMVKYFTSSCTDCMY